MSEVSVIRVGVRCPRNLSGFLTTKREVYDHLRK